jgi:hypothetical protein
MGSNKSTGGSKASGGDQGSGEVAASALPEGGDSTAVAALETELLALFPGARPEELLAIVKRAGEVASRAEELEKKLAAAVKGGPTLDGQGAGEAKVLLERRIMQLEGEKADHAQKLLAARQETETVRGELEALRTKLTAQSVSLLPDLGDDAAELLDSVTISTILRDGKVAPGYARQGDVVTLDDPAELQGRLGKKATVYRVTEDTAEELEKLGLIRHP